MYTPETDSAFVVDTGDDGGAGSDVAATMRLRQLVDHARLNGRLDRANAVLRLVALKRTEAGGKMTSRR